jgi:hypothetical protein
MNQRLEVIILPKALDFPLGLRLCSALATANAGFSPELYGRLRFPLPGRFGSSAVNRNSRSE